MKFKIMLWILVILFLSSFAFGAEDWLTPMTMTDEETPAPYKASNYLPFNADYAGHSTFDKTTSKYQTDDG